MSAPPNNTLVGKVIHVDRFGNLVTSIGRLLWRGDELLVQPAFSTRREEKNGQRPLTFNANKTRVHIAGQRIESIQPTYGDAPQGQLLALVGSAGHLEIAVAGGNAAEALGAGVGLEAILEMEGR
jgi:S-adenosylmethionine hydrolase